MLASNGAVQRDDSHAIRLEVRSLLATLSQHVLCRQLMISGPAARGEPGVCCLEVIADLRAEPFRPARVRDFQTLLKLTHPLFGKPDRLQPYLMFADHLLVRCSAGNYWVEAEDAAALRARFEAEMVPVRSLAGAVA